MGNRRQDRRAKKLRKKYIPYLRQPVTISDILADQAEIQLFFAIRRFEKLVRAVKKQLYHKPQHVIRTKNYDNRLVTDHARK